MSRVRLQWSLPTVIVGALLLAACGTNPAAADDNRAFLPKSDPVRVELPQGAEVLKHPLAAGLLATLQKSTQWETIEATPQFDRLRLLGQLIAKSTGEDWQTGLRKLTAGGVAVSFAPGKKPGITAVIAASDEATLKRFLQTVKQHARSRLPEPQRSRVYRTVRRDGREITRIGPAAYAVVGNRLVVASTEKRLLDALTRAAKSPKQTAGKRKAYARVSIDVAAIRKTPGLAKGLKLPAKDAGGIAILGGWLDLLRKGDRITAEVVPDGESLEIRVRSTAKRTNTTPGLTGYFTDGQRKKIAPLLRLPNTIYAASWYRDYRALWNGRAKLLTAEGRKKLEEGNQTIQQPLSVIGARALPSRAFSLLGTRFRAVVVRQDKPEYDVELASRLPAAGLAIELRDETAFQTEVVPLFRGVSLILTLGQQKMLLHKEKHNGADLAGLKFRSNSAAASQGNRIRFNFAPTYAVARKHLLVGSTPTIVRQMIDEIDRQSREHASVTTTATEMQRLSLTEAARAVREFGSTLILAGTFTAGLSVAEAKQELDLFTGNLESVGEITTEAGFDKHGFLYRVHIGKQSR